MCTAHTLAPLSERSESYRVHCTHTSPSLCVYTAHSVTLHRYKCNNNNYSRCTVIDTWHAASDQPRTYISPSPSRSLSPFSLPIPARVPSSLSLSTLRGLGGGVQSEMTDFHCQHSNYTTPVSTLSLTDRSSRGSQETSSPDTRLTPPLPVPPSPLHHGHWQESGRHHRQEKTLHSDKMRQR